MTFPDTTKDSLMFDDDEYDLTTVEGITARAADVLRKRIPPRYQAAEVTEPAVIAWCGNLTAAAPGTARSLLLTGPTGAGKTWQAYGAVRRLVTAGTVDRWDALTAADLYARLRPRDGTDSEAEFERFASVPLLLLDDLGAAKDSEWTEEVTYRLVNHRSAWVLPTVFTTNLTVRTLKAALSERVFSRLAECDTVSLKHADRRTAGAS